MRSAMQMQMPCLLAGLWVCFLEARLLCLDRRAAVGSVHGPSVIIPCLSRVWLKVRVRVLVRYAQPW